MTAWLVAGMISVALTAAPAILVFREPILNAKLTRVYGALAMKSGGAFQIDSASE